MTSPTYGGKTVEELRALCEALAKVPLGGFVESYFFAAARTALPELLDRIEQLTTANADAFNMANAELASIRAERDKLREGLRPFADEADRYLPVDDDDDSVLYDYGSKALRLRDLRRARSLLNGGKE